MHMIYITYPNCPNEMTICAVHKAYKLMKLKNHDVFILTSDNFKIKRNIGYNYISLYEVQSFEDSTIMLMDVEDYLDLSSKFIDRINNTKVIKLMYYQVSDTLNPIPSHIVSYNERNYMTHKEAKSVFSINQLF